MDPPRGNSGFSVTIDRTGKTIKPARGPRVLVLDDGRGVLSISLLQYLEEIMQAISIVKDKDDSVMEGVQPTLPCDYFDLICGSRMGGLYAVLLGHLGMSVDDVFEWLREHAVWVYQPDSNLNRFLGSYEGVSTPPNWRRQCFGSDMKSRWRVCLKTLMEKRLGPVAGGSQPFTSPITGKSCKTCVLTSKTTWKTYPSAIRMRIHRFRSYHIGDSNMEGNSEERNCPIWKVALITAYDTMDDEELIVDTSKFTNNAHEHEYGSLIKGLHPRADNEAYDEMVQIWKSIGDSCFVSIDSMRKEDFTDRNPFGSTLLQGLAQSLYEPGDQRPDLLEMSLPESATLHRFGFRVRFQIKSGMWEAWLQVLEASRESQSKPPRHTERIENCALRLFGAPYSNIGGSSSVDPMPSISPPVGSSQGAKQRPTPERASDNSDNQEAGALYDVTTSDYNTISTVQTPVDNWFKRIRETNQTFFGGIKPEGSAVRVAILDTGINEKYPELQVNQIKDKWSFNPSLIEGHEDLDGHGSHAAAVLLRVAPNCTIYIARVFKDTRDVNAQNFAYINKALRCAIDDWKVDIISMSFGFSKDPKNVEFKELLTQEAARKGVLIFSAASNSGANDDIAFPACWRGHVFCINSTDTNGNPSRFDPPRDSKGYNFSTLGESVPGPIPDMNSEQLEYQIRSGTSIATPIAAGIAALILEFSRIRGVNIKNVAKLKTFDGMATVLEDISIDVGGYQYLRPWKIADSTENNQKVYAGHLDFILGRR